MNKHKAEKLMNKFNLINKMRSIINCNDWKYYDDNDNDSENDNDNENENKRKKKFFNNI